ncbi:MAG: DUF4115 domain-containing protein [Gammaproteobacteria bacterium]|nr:DUF4115 domain-containing protein [Gammaproteobacteria bacterium]
MENQPEQQQLKDIITSREDGFGHRFRTARDEKNLSISDVARKLRLNEKIILALESEDHTQLPVPAFVCGYIRNYAKFLDIQPEPLIAYYKREYGEDSLEPKLKSSKKAGNRQNVISFNVIMPIFMVLILATLATGGWQLWLYMSKNYFAANEPAVATEQSEIDYNSAALDEQVNEAPGSLSLPVLDEVYDLPSVEDSSQQSSRTGDDLPGPENSLQVDGSLQADGSTQAEGASSAEGSFATNGNFINSPTGAGDPAEVALDAPVSEIAPIATDNKLILRFSGKSWISIKDANNKILSTGLKKTGKTLQLEGKRPYKVFLGDARVVKVSINGKTIDHAKYINEKNIARFNVK